MEKEFPRDGFSAFWRDGFGFWGVLAPFVSFVVSVAKIYEVPMSEIRDLDWAWVWAPVFLWVGVAYVRRWQASKTLAERLTPKFKLSLHFTGHEVKDAQDRVGYKFVNVSVDNTSEVNLTQCVARLSGLLKDGKPTEFEKTIPLEWSHPKGVDEKMIVAKDEGIVHVVTARSHGHNLKFWGGIPWARFKDTFNDHATYRFTVLVNCDGVSREIEFDVKWNGQWDQVQAHEVKNG